MTSGIERRAADAAVPEAMYAVDVAAEAAVVVAIPVECLGAFVDFQAEAAAIYLRFGGPTVDVDATATSAVDGGVLTEDATTPQLHVPADGERRRRLRRDVTHMAIIGSGAGVLRFGAGTGGWPDD